MPHFSGMVKVTLPLALSLSLVCFSCMLGPRYPEISPQRGKTALIKETIRFEESVPKTVISVNNVGGKWLKYTARTGQQEQVRSGVVEAGRHVLKVGIFHVSPEHDNGTLSGTAKIEADLKADHIYIADGSVESGGIVKVWLRDEGSGRIATPVVVVNPHRIRSTGPLILLPAG